MNFFDIQLVRYTGKVIYPAGRTTASTHRLNDSTPQRLNRCGHNGGCGGCGTSSSRWSLSGGMAKRWSMVAAPGCCRLSARLDVRRGLNAARPSRAMHSLGLSMSRKRAPCLPKAGPCFDSTARQDMFWGRAGMNARPRWGKRAVYAALNSCSTPPTVAPRANAIPLPLEHTKVSSSQFPHACSQPCRTRADIVTRVPSTASESSAPLAHAPALTCAACHLPVHSRIAKVYRGPAARCW